MLHEGRAKVVSCPLRRLAHSIHRTFANQTSKFKMPPARGTYASPSYASPPPPVLVTEADLPRVIAVAVFGTLAASWLALQLDAYFAADDQHNDFYFPYERTAALEALSMVMACYLCVIIDSPISFMCMCVFWCRYGRAAGRWGTF